MRCHPDRHEAECRIGLDASNRFTQDVGSGSLDCVLAKNSKPQFCASMRAPERELGTLLAGWFLVLVEDIDLAPFKPGVGQQSPRRQRHEQRAAEVIVAVD